jgi:hypothetical protein
MSAIAASIRRGLSLAVTAVLSLAVLLAGSGLHPTAHCSDHQGGAEKPGLAVVQADRGLSGGDADQEDLCLSCECPCQSSQLGGSAGILLPDGEATGLVRAALLSLADEVFIEVEPPPDRSV